MKVDFLIDGASVGASRRDVHASRSGHRQDRQRGGGGGRRRRRQGGRGGLARFRELVGDRPRRTPRAAAQGGRPARKPRRRFRQADDSKRSARPAPWAGFNVHFAASMLREAAAMTTQITGEVIPSDKPGVLSLAMRQPAGVVLGMAPWNAPVILGVRAIAAPLACGNTVILRSSEVCPATHRLIVQTLQRRGLSQGRRQRDHQRAGGRAASGRGADRPSGGQAHQFHRLVASRQDHRQARGRTSEAGAARTRRQGAADRARRRRSRRGGRRGRVRRLRQPGPDLHVDRAAHRRRDRSPTLSSRSSPSARRRCRPAIRAAMSCSARWSISRRPSAWTR